MFLSFQGANLRFLFGFATAGAGCLLKFKQYYFQVILQMKENVAVIVLRVVDQQQHLPAVSKGGAETHPLVICKAAVKESQVGAESGHQGFPQAAGGGEGFEGCTGWDDGLWLIEGVDDVNLMVS